MKKHKHCYHVVSVGHGPLIGKHGKYIEVEASFINVCCWCLKKKSNQPEGEGA